MANMHADVLLQTLYCCPPEAAILFVADENMSADRCSSLAAFKNLTLLTNRFDIYEAAKTNLPNAKNVLFSDFDCRQLESGAFDIMAYRISKERPVAHWLLNQSVRLLAEGGTLLLLGKKDEGIKGYIEKSIKQLGFLGGMKKHGPLYLGTLKRTGTGKVTKLLDDKNYPHIRTIGDRFGVTVASKPGQYGWQKFDEGSALLVDQLQCWPGLPAVKRALDLGCGYGFLSLALAQAGVPSIIATDNNAAALECCRTNMDKMSSSVKVIAANCADTIEEVVELIVCNPPFHQGFSIESELTTSFLAAAKRLLTRNGTAFFVVNAFIPLEKLSRSYFARVDVLANNRKFKVLALQH